MTGWDYTKRDYLLPKGCKDLADALVINLQGDPTVAQLATSLGQKPVKLIADLFQLGVFASAQQTLTFETAGKVALKYGYVGQTSVTRLLSRRAILG